MKGHISTAITSQGGGSGSMPRRPSAALVVSIAVLAAVIPRQSVSVRGPRVAGYNENEPRFEDLEIPNSGLRNVQMA
jgi:hypothetical protein